MHSTTRRNAVNRNPIRTSRSPGRGATGTVSDDQATSWIRINDDAHQRGWTGPAITGDPRLHGRVYLATNGRGIQYGEPA
ncbi:hypothetical protein [Streptomyces camelliae]|uniref:Uncharacterized protein n=1 Tax=Streptomyces camelliae TaxID=3004093 RepID=A0ABY7PFV7_9ACTN|nr:hypothetical protein [Streptomyces sp. HUAS 2-6]WBO69518.1 hypothetical protein O1G22_12105 [Streptomyces sp. HUAS 2-6]